jgi:hypothetical protein
LFFSQAQHECFTWIPRMQAVGCWQHSKYYSRRLAFVLKLTSWQFIEDDAVCASHADFSIWLLIEYKFIDLVLKQTDDIIAEFDLLSNTRSQWIL